MSLPALPHTPSSFLPYRIADTRVTPITVYHYSFLVLGQYFGWVGQSPVAPSLAPLWMETGGSTGMAGASHRWPRRRHGCIHRRGDDATLSAYLARACALAVGTPGGSRWGPGRKPDATPSGAVREHAWRLLPNGIHG